ncbi:MAG: GNAT family N-acetyltransferase [Aerococcus sp.]|nr:GNAT family N-acetyltransferase [Aerococcus sp.]
MLQLREVKQEEINACIRLVQAAFDDYLFFKAYVDDPERKEQFYNKLMEIWVRSIADRHTLYVGEEFGEIQAVAGVQRPHQKDIENRDYLDYGGREALAIAGEDDTKRFLEMLAISDEPCHAIPQPKWYFELLAVRTDRSGRGIGTRMFTEGLLPLVAQNGGGITTLNTNTEPNVRFYLKNGFKVIDERWLHANGHEIPNWSFVRNVEPV